MNKLSIHSIEGKGELEKECVFINVIEDVDNLSYYMLCDTTYKGDNGISNELRHMYWFAPGKVKKGDWIKLMTKVGKNTTRKNNRDTTTHIIYWNLGKTVWNKDGDAAVLFNLNTWKTTRV